MKLNQIDHNKLNVFCQIVDSGNYRLAGEVLNVTPSALSQSVAVLEHSLGFPLFHRVGKKLVVTESGMKLHREFRNYHGAFHQALQKIVQEKDEVQGTLRIGAYLEFAKSQLSPLLSGFLKAHPQAQAKMTFATPSRLQHLLEKNQLDLCFSIFPSVQTRLIDSRPVYREELVLIAPKGLLPEKPNLPQLLETPIIEYYMNHQPIRRWIALHYQKKPQNLLIRAFASTAEMVHSLVKEGAGIGMVPRFILDAPGAMTGLSILRPTDRQFVDHIWMLERKLSNKPPIHGAFVGHFLQRK